MSDAEIPVGSHGRTPEEHGGLRAWMFTRLRRMLPLPGVLLAACQASWGVTGAQNLQGPAGDIGPQGSPGDAFDMPTSGTRLKWKPQRFVMSDGAESPIRSTGVWFDTLLNDECTIGRGIDGKWHCFRASPVRAFYCWADSSCTTPVDCGAGTVDPCPIPPRRMFCGDREGLSACARDQVIYCEVWDVEPMSEGVPIYTVDNTGTCIPYGQTAATGYFQGTRQHPLSDFVSGSLEEE